jgi:hypothetical protein
MGRNAKAQEAKLRTMNAELRTPDFKGCGSGKSVATAVLRLSVKV